MRRATYSDTPTVDLTLGYHDRADCVPQGDRCVAGRSRISAVKQERCFSISQSIDAPDLISCQGEERIHNHVKHRASISEPVVTAEVERVQKPRSGFIDQRCQ